MPFTFSSRSLKPLKQVPSQRINFTERHLETSRHWLHSPSCLYLQLLASKHLLAQWNGRAGVFCVPDAKNGFLLLNSMSFNPVQMSSLEKGFPRTLALIPTSPNLFPPLLIAAELQALPPYSEHSYNFLYFDSTYCVPHIMSIMPVFLA